MDAQLVPMEKQNLKIYFYKDFDMLKRPNRAHSIGERKMRLNMHLPFLFSSFFVIFDNILIEF